MRPGPRDSWARQSGDRHRPLMLGKILGRRGSKLATSASDQSCGENARAFARFPSISNRGLGWEGREKNGSVRLGDIHGIGWRCPDASCRNAGRVVVRMLWVGVIQSGAWHYCRPAGGKVIAEAGLEVLRARPTRKRVPGCWSICAATHSNFFATKHAQVRFGFCRIVEGGSSGARPPRLDQAPAAPGLAGDHVTVVPLGLARQLGLGPPLLVKGRKFCARRLARDACARGGKTPLIAPEPRTRGHFR